MSTTGRDVATDSKEERLEQVSQQLFKKSYDDLSVEERLKVGSTVGGESSAEGYTTTVHTEKGSIDSPGAKGG